MENNMKNLSECIREARTAGRAIGHFNISNMEGFSAVVMAAKELNVPVIIGVSEGERDFLGTREIVAVVKSYRERTGQAVFLNADHTYSFEKVVEAVDAGFDMVIYDGTEHSFEENIEITKKCLEYAKSKNPSIVFEGEIGFIGKSSKLLDSVPDGVGKMTTPEEAKTFVESTKVDLLAPAVGNVHGMVKGGEPALNIARIAEISMSSGVPLVLHGASGNSKEDIVSAIDAGVVIVHINTELRVAYRSGLMKSLQENPDELSPYKYLKGARNAMQKIVEEKLKIFNKI
ncbi:MAG: class II fructose-bisphosphate aldolase [bacterium]|nr:class II fructose-bisphosphate aldolase [bacterium]